MLDTASVARANQDDRERLTQSDIDTIYVNEITGAVCWSVGRSASWPHRASAVLDQVAKALGLRQRVFATALVYLRRFYVKCVRAWRGVRATALSVARRHSFSDFDPRLVAPACLWLASKVEESPIGHVRALVRQLSAIAGRCRASVFGGASHQTAFSFFLAGHTFDQNDILQCEFYVLESLEANLIVYHAYPLLDEYVNDVDRHLPQVECRKYFDTLWKIVNDAYRTTACLQHAPHIIALGCMHIVATVYVRLLRWCRLAAGGGSGGAHTVRAGTRPGPVVCATQRRPQWCLGRRQTNLRPVRRVPSCENLSFWYCLFSYEFWHQLSGRTTTRMLLEKLQPDYEIV